ncbi:hypothetical protein [Enterococcus sp. DIV1420a]|uniref:hypothetical protein n=1 Tax=Enterococcus sp. DIV1420a TaxID=2774672 RepID=UPI003F25F0C6
MKIITLCGSMKFIKVFRKVEVILTRKGFLVLSPVFDEGIEISKEDAELFGKYHFRKIDLADEIFVIDVEGYIGKSTKKEIEYAKSNDKQIRYYSKEIVNSYLMS